MSRRSAPAAPGGGAAGSRHPHRRGARLVATAVAALPDRVRRHDLPLVAAGLTFYAAVGVIPLLLVAIRLASVPLGAATARSDLLVAAGLVPAPARSALAFFARTGPSLPVTSALAALLPIGLYGEGLVRAFARLSPEKVRRRALRGRLAAAAGLVVVPAALCAALPAAAALRGSGLLLGIYLAFLIAWGLATLALMAAYRLLTPASPGPVALAWSAASTGSVVAGFGLGFLLFLALQLNVGAAFGGRSALAIAAMAALWAYGLHLAALLGYAWALGIDAQREGRR